jgi:hypothetical protein
MTTVKFTYAQDITLDSVILMPVKGTAHDFEPVAIHSITANGSSFTFNNGLLTADFDSMVLTKQGE